MIKALSYPTTGPQGFRAKSVVVQLAHKTGNVPSFKELWEHIRGEVLGIAEL